MITDYEMFVDVILYPLFIFIVLFMIFCGGYEN